MVTAEDLMVDEEEAASEPEEISDDEEQENVRQPTDQSERVKQSYLDHFHFAERSIRAAVGEARNREWADHFSSYSEDFPSRVFTDNTLDGCVAYYKYRCHDKVRKPPLKKFNLARDAAAAQDRRNYDKLPVVIWRNARNTNPEVSKVEDRWMRRTGYVKDTYVCYDENAVRQKWKLDGRGEEMGTYLSLIHI